MLNSFSAYFWVDVRLLFKKPQYSLAIILAVFLAGCGLVENSGSPSTTPPPVQPIQFTADSATQSSISTINLVTDVMRIARGGMVLDGKLRPAAYPSGAFVTDASVTSDANLRSIRTPQTSAYSGCPVITQPNLVSSKGYSIIIDYGSSCVDSLDGISRSGKITIKVSDVYMLVSGGIISANSDIAYENYTVNGQQVSGSSKVHIESPTLEHWDIALSARDNSGKIESIKYTATVTSSQNSDIETINGNGTYINADRQTTQITFNDLQFDLDNFSTSVVCHTPVGGSLVLTGNNIATMSYQLTSTGCGFAKLTIEGVDQGMVALTSQGPDLTLSDSYRSWNGTVGDIIYGSLRVINQGAVAAHDVTLTLKTIGIELPTLYEDYGYCAAVNGLTCSLNTINPGEYIYLHFSFRATAAGISQITAEFAKNSSDINLSNDSIKVSVVVHPLPSYDPQPPQPITRIELSTKVVTLPSGEARRILATAYLDAMPIYDPSLIWESSDPAIASVDSTGLITAVAPGDTTITVSSNGVTNNATVTVTIDQITKLSLPTNDMIYDPYSKKLYASVPSAGGTIGNSITIIDPATARIERSVFIGSEPGKLALSDDGQYLYVVLNGASSIRRFNVATQTAGLQFAVNQPLSFSTTSVIDMAVMPGNPETIAILQQYGYVTIYDNDVARQNSSQPYSFSNIEFTDSSSTLYGFGYSTISKLSIDGTGITNTTILSSAYINNTDQIILSNGFMYTIFGRVFDFTSGTLLGTFKPSLNQSFDSGSRMTPDTENGRVYFVTFEYDWSNGGSPGKIRSYESSTYLLKETLMTSKLTDYPLALTKWGDTGLAIRTSNDIIIVNAPLFMSVTQ